MAAKHNKSNRIGTGKGLANVNRHNVKPSHLTLYVWKYICIDLIPTNQVKHQMRNASGERERVIETESEHSLRLCACMQEAESKPHNAWPGGCGEQYV